MKKNMNKKIITIMILSLTLFSFGCKTTKKKAKKHNLKKVVNHSDNKVSILVKEAYKKKKKFKIIDIINKEFITSKFYNPYLEKIEERKKREIAERKRLKEIQRLKEEELQKQAQLEKNKVIIHKIPTLITKRIEIITPEAIIKNIEESFYGVIEVKGEFIAIIGEQLIETNNIFEVLDKKNNSHAIIIIDINEKELIVEYMGKKYSIKVPSNKEN